MNELVKTVRHAAGATKRWLMPAENVAAWRRASRVARRTPRFEAGCIEMAGYSIRYPDLLTLCPQWYDIFVTGILEFHACTETPRVLDCGANVGLASLYFKRLYPGARITAFEADPNIARLLVSNLQANGARDVEVVPAAVWTSSGHVAFRAEGADGGAVDAIAGTLDAPLATVPACRLADIIASGPIDLLKLDIEGAESAVLEDCRGVLSNVRAMMVEIHEFDVSRRRVPQILDTLAECGFTYAAGELTELPWRPPVAGPATPFPNRALCWVLSVRAWRQV